MPDNTNTELNLSDFCLGLLIYKKVEIYFQLLFNKVAFEIYSFVQCYQDCNFGSKLRGERSLKCVEKGSPITAASRHETMKCATFMTQHQNCVSHTGLHECVDSLDTRHKPRSSTTSQKIVALESQQVVR